MTNISAAAKKPLNDYIVEKTGYVVQSGPFAGMKMLEEKSWDDGNIGCQLLGCYEQELHPVIEEEIARLSELKHPIIANIGCAEGFYAVGLARRIPNASIYCVDIDEKALEIAAKAADANNVSSQIIVKQTIGKIMEKPDLVFSDCEGAEFEYLDPSLFNSLRAATVICECHDGPTRQVTPILLERFRPTHSIEMLREAGRDPNNFMILQHMHSLDRWIAVSEGRPCMMHWMIMRPRRSQSEAEAAAA